MTTARSVIQTALRVHLNRLSPGETVDADTLDVCLDALNDIVDEWNGVKSFLFREILSASSTISSASAVLGTAWSGLSPGDEILGATYSDGSQDHPMYSLTMAQYQAISDKTATGQPCYYAHDGLATVYLSPVPTGHVITLRTKAVVSEFAAVDTDYSMPKGYRSALSALLAEKMAPTMIGGVTAAISAAARAAKLRIGAQASNPAILGDDPVHYDINRGY